jgi:toxin ParE1/3/4
VSIQRYLVRGKADQDLEEQAYYLGLNAGAELGHRFLLAAHATFALLAEYPELGWRSGIVPKRYGVVRMFPVRGFDRILILYRKTSTSIEILRVVHGSRNLRRLFRKEGLE